MPDNSKMIAVLTILTPILMIMYLYPKHELAKALVLFLIAGSTLNLAFLTSSLRSDITWIITFSAALYHGLTLVLPDIASLFTGYVVFLLFAGIYAAKFSDKQDQWNYYVPLTITFIVIIDIIYGGKLLLWIIFSPMIELELLSGVSQDEKSSIGRALGYGITYVLSYSLPPIAIIYTLLAITLRAFHARLRVYKILPIDTALRLAIGVFG